MMPAQAPAARLRLKRSSGWFAAGLEVSTALPLLSDAAFKLYMFLCLNVDRRSARMIWAPTELASKNFIRVVYHSLADKPAPEKKPLLKRILRRS